MDSRLTFDISRQLRQRMGSGSVDAADCYNCINHFSWPPSSSPLQAGPLLGVVALLLPIQKMKFNHRTGLGGSTTFMGGPGLQMLLQGLCQRNGAAPACWTMLATVLM